jgi:hypothetical protein
VKATRRRGTTLTEILIAAVIAVALIGLVVGFLAGTRRQEARTTRRLDDLTEATRIARALEKDLRSAYTDGAHRPRVAGDTLTLAVVKAPAPHALAAPVIGQVAYTFDAPSGTVSRHEDGRMQIVGRLQDGGRMTFETTDVADGGAVIVARVQPARSEQLHVGARPLVVSRAIFPPARTAGALPWIGPGAEAAPAGTPAD